MWWKAVQAAEAIVLVGLGGCANVEFADGTDASSTNYVSCGTDSNWEDDWRLYENDIVELINDVRGQGAYCGDKGYFPPAEPLDINEEIRCAAREHSMDMAVRDYFAHTNPDGEDPWDRMEKQGYDYYAAGENIAAGFKTPEEAVRGWLESDGHCANLMSDGYLDTGVGYFQKQGSTYQYYWTEDFGSPSESERQSQE